jgi:hypothetical protein
MPDPFWVALAQAVQNWATAIAVLVGGVWAYYRFGIKRESETALAIDLAHTSVPYDANYLVFFDVCLENKGAVRLGAKRKRRSAYEDEAEVLAYAVDLLLRPVPPGSAPGSRVGWFGSETDTSPRVSDVELDLVAEYEIDGETDFWMEPGESYHLGAGVVLSAGSYLAMVTFVGDRSDEEFWRRVFLVQVPKLQAVASNDRMNPPAGVES